MKIFLPNRKSITNTYRGFTVIELLVAIGIFMILSSTFLANYNTFNKRVSLDTLAHQIAQWVRSAQVSAMSVKHSQTQSGLFPGYGIHFDIATPDRFIYFADIGDGAGGAPNKRYDPPTGGAVCGDAGEECEKEVILMQGNRIVSLCGDAPSGVAVTTRCVTVGADDTSSIFDIAFTRPNPDAIITGDLNGVSFPTAYSRARITVSSVVGYERVVEVWTTGQISVQ